MAIRLRRIGELEWVALCAAKHPHEEGDVYLDDAQHQALTEKYLRVWDVHGPTTGRHDD